MKLRLTLYLMSKSPPSLRPFFFTDDFYQNFADDSTPSPADSTPTPTAVMDDSSSVTPEPVVRFEVVYNKPCFIFSAI